MNIVYNINISVKSAKDAIKVAKELRAAGEVVGTVGVAPTKTLPRFDGGEDLKEQYEKKFGKRFRLTHEQAKAVKNKQTTQEQCLREALAEVAPEPQETPSDLKGRKIY